MGALGTRRREGRGNSVIVYLVFAKDVGFTRIWRWKHSDVCASNTATTQVGARIELVRRRMNDEVVLRETKVSFPPFISRLLSSRIHLLATNHGGGHLETLALFVDDVSVLQEEKSSDELGASMKQAVLSHEEFY